MIDIEGIDLVTFFGKVDGHREPHISETNEADFGK
jgi:hypothetical protein